MPLVYQQNINETTRLAVWHIAEDEKFFLSHVPLPATITHPRKRLQHLAGRFLLPQLFEEFPLKLIQVADTRKPYLPGEAFHFSISPCGDYAAEIVSRDHRVGVDIEVMSSKVVKVKDKFLGEAEQLMINGMAGNKENGDYVKLLTLAWGVKETLFKWHGSGEVDFKDHLHINDIGSDGNSFTVHCLFNMGTPRQLKVNGLFFNGNFLTWLVS